MEKTASKPAHIALLIMCKNESFRIHVTLESIIGFVDSVVCFDTGSTDNTIEIVQNFCAKNNIPLHLKQGTFSDFSTSRNESLDFADTFSEIDYLLLMDINDELRGGQYLRKVTSEFSSKPQSAFLVCQQWYSGRLDYYYNVRFVKTRCGWRYKGRVHEYMQKNNTSTTEVNDDTQNSLVKLSDELILYQDRTKDDDKSAKRYARDKVLLLEDYKQNPKEPRTLFYLAQTCECLNQQDDAYYYYKLRSKEGGFQEEVFHALHRLGKISIRLKHDFYDSTIGWFMKAFEHSKRAEPLVDIADYYLEKKQWALGFNFASMACELTYPSNCLLFIDKNVYDYQRWHLLGIAGYYVQKYKEGKMGCLKAIEAGHNSELDKMNLTFYENIEKEEAQKDMTKKQFFTAHEKQLRSENPKITEKQLNTKLKKMWKKN